MTAMLEFLIWALCVWGLVWLLAENNVLKNKNEALQWRLHRTYKAETALHHRVDSLLRQLATTTEALNSAKVCPAVAAEEGESFLGASRSSAWHETLDDGSRFSCGGYHALARPN